MSKVNTRELEQQIFDKEEIRVVIRSPKNTMFEEYNYDRKAAVTTSISDWLSTRLKPIIGASEAEVIDGHGNIPHGRTQIENVRNSYVEK